MESAVFLCVLLGLLVCGAKSSGNCDFGTRDDEHVLCASHPGVTEINHNISLKVYIKPSLPQETSCTLQVLGNTHILELPDEVTLEGGNSTVAHIHIRGKRAGTSKVSFNATECNVTFHRLNKVEREISIIHLKALDILSIVVGWIYFAAWSISFYPQIIENFWRRSVVGLNFDFLALNITGFVAYLMFNIGLFWIPAVEKQYMDQHPGGVNPVQINDVVFTLHAVAATAFTIFQCFIFERGKQRVSYTAWVILAALWLVVFITLFVAVGGKLSWLNFLYVFSYVKLVVTLIKYVPQVVMNCRRRSTVGWSIGNVLLDFTGGTFSILQMFIISYNYNDWKSIFGDPTKFGLGAFSICFDLIFMFQHYCLFWGKKPRDSNEGGYKKIEEKCPKNGVKEVVGQEDDYDDVETEPLLGKGGEKKPGKCRQLLNFLNLK